ncbi:MAG: hypothetical protein ACPG32_02235 [Akkermansiaceae bacterium]
MALLILLEFCEQANVLMKFFSLLHTPKPAALFVLALGALALPSCGLWKKPHFTTNPPATSMPASPVAPAPEVIPAPLDPSLPAPSQTQTWVLRLNPNKSTGKLDLTLDPNRALVGERAARSHTPLQGTVTLKVQPLRDGRLRFSLTKIHLTNQNAMNMHFQWAGLIGSIQVSIPPKVLKISHHSSSQQGIVSVNQRFSTARNYFTVGGTARVSGRGPVMSRGVGARNVDLTIRKTEPVTLTGTLSVRNGIATLHIPRAVMKDKFDMEGTDLGMVFTGEIFATGKVPR